MSDKVRFVLAISILAIVAIVIFIYTNSIAWLVDDINYQFNMAGTALQRIQSVWDIFESQWLHYFFVNGRYVAHWLVQLYCGILGQTAFAVCNAIVYVIYIVMVLKLSGTNIRNTLGLCSTAILILFMYDTNYGPACQIGFVWTFAAVIAWMYVFFSDKIFSVYASIGLFFISVIIGWGQEAISIGISGALIMYSLRNYKSMNITQWMMFFGFGLGTLLLCVSPASLGRTEKLDVSLFVTMFNLFSFLRVFYVFLIVLIWSKICNKISLKNFYTENSFYIDSMIILFLFNIVIGIYGNRQLMGIEIMAIILTLRLLPNCSLNRYALVAMTIIVTCIYVVKWQIINHCRATYIDVVELYHKSNDGIVYYDIIYPPNTNICQPASTFSKLNRGVQTLDRLLRSEGYNKELRVYPKCLENINTENVKNQIVEFDKGCYVVIQSKKNPAEFVLKRELDFGLYKRPFKDFIFSWNDPLVETDTYRANVIYDEVPFVNNIGIEIVEQ